MVITLRIGYTLPSIKRRIERFLGDVWRGGKTKPKIPTTLIAVSMVVFVVFITGGGIYDIIENPPAIIPGPQGGWIAVHPYIGEQTLNESLVSMTLTSLAFIGMLVAYRSSKVVYDSNKANTMLILGIALVLLGLAGSHWLLILKRMALR